jgi:hypothetical protein
MKTFFALLLMTTAAFSQNVNNATVNIQGSIQNVSITQFNSNHFVNLQLVGDGINVSVTQSGNTPQSFSLNISCYSVCPSSPYVVNQY